MTVESDLDKKMRLESQLTDELKEYNSELVAAILTALAAGGLFTATRKNDDLKDILKVHYSRVSDDFFGLVAKELPDSVKMTGEEKKRIALVLDRYFDETARSQAEIINKTTDKDILSSIGAASIEAESQGVSGAAIPVLTAAFMQQRLNARTESIATTETQLAAETTKATEAQVLSGSHPTITGGDPRKTQAKKRWDTVGDKLVRDAHDIADTQEVLINEPFVVGGEKLMFPRDQSLGASIGNWINCRCSATYLTDDIAEIRGA